jgi:multidrug efflux pump subunit AcrA (membrane-fusion protein)
MPDIIAGMKDLLYGQTGFISDQRSSYLSSTARTYRETAGIEYDAAVNLYQKSMNEFKSTNRSSATSTIDQMLTNTYATIKAMSKAVSDTQVALTFITTTQPDYYPKDAPTASANIITWATKTNGDLSSLASAQNSIDTSENSYTTLIAGTDNLDLEQAKLTLQQAQQTYDNYFVRAPYDGVIGRIPVNVYNQASGSTVMATIVGAHKIATISLNEVDAAKVKVGQPVNVTFDAIDGLTATGTVSVVDQIGAVSSGVVSYGIKISINTDDGRVKSGMSVNTSIITAQKDNVIIVPSAAIKTQTGKSYVQIFDQSVLASIGQFASSTRQFGGQYATTSDATSTNQRFASSTRQYIGSSTFQRSTASQAETRTITISSAVAPKQVTITTGLSDDTNTEIISGLNRGQLIVTRTIAASGTQTTTAPSILNSLGSRTGGGGGGGRAGGMSTPTGR